MIGGLGFYYSQKVFLTTGTGESMLPTFDNCTFLVVYKDKDLSTIKTGDIVIVNVSDDSSFSSETIAHRVVKNNINEMLISTKGDNNEVIDGDFSYEKILGRVVLFFERPENICSYKTEENTQEELPVTYSDYSCNAEEWDSYVENNLQGLTKTEQLFILNESCSNPYGEASASFWVKIVNPPITKFFSNGVRTGCSVEDTAGSVFTVWAFKTSSLGGVLLPDGNYQNFILQETGICFPEVKA